MGRAGADELFERDARTRIADIDGGAGRGRLLGARVLGIVSIAERGRALRDRGRHVEGGVSDRAPRARRHVAVEIVGEAGIGDPVQRAGDGRHRVRARLACRWVRVGADIGFRGDVAKLIVSEGLDHAARRTAGPVDGRIGQPVEAVITELLGQALVEVLAARDIADGVEAVGEVGHRVACPRLGGLKTPGVGIEGLHRGDAVARDLGEGVKLGVARRHRPIDLAAHPVFQLILIAGGRVDILGDEAGGIGDAGDMAVGIVGGDDGVDVAVDRQLRLHRAA